MPVKTLDELLRIRATALAEKPCVRSAEDGTALSYGELDRRASVFAAALRRRGCRAGDRVVLGFGNTPELFSALFGCLRAGLIAVPVDPRLAAGELQTIVDHAAPAAVVLDDGTESHFERLRLGSAALSVAEGLETADEPAWPEEPESPGCDTPALLLYTSGTTGNPKGALFSHGSLVAKVQAIARWFGLDESCASLCLLPTHFGHGLICNCLSTFGYGGTLVIAPPFNLDLLGRLWPILDRHEVSTFSSVPTVIRLLNRYAERRGSKAPASLKFVTCASAPLRPQDVEEFQSNFGVPLLNCYGLTETSGWSACSPNLPGRNLASVGKALDCEIRIVDPSREPLKPGEEGELQIKGPGVMIGYYENPGGTAEVLRDGWFSTGDIGEIDETGAIFLYSRIKELIIRAGKNIYPAEVDHALMSHPEVVEACTVGLEDPLLGEKVAACVVLRRDSALGEAALIAHVQERLAAYKCPERISFVEQIPKSSRGKVRRSRLRSLF